MVTLLINACSKKSPQLQDGESDAASKSETSISEIRTSEQLKFERGIAALTINDYSQAQRIFGEIIRLNPNLSGPYANLALISFKQKNYEQSLKQVNKALALNPLQAQAYHLRAQIQLHNGEIRKAEEDYRKAIDLDPKYRNAHYNLALLYDIYLQEIALAIKHYTIYMTLLEKEDERTQEWINHLKNTLKNG